MAFKLTKKQQDEQGELVTKAKQSLNALNEAI